MTVSRRAPRLRRRRQHGHALPVHYSLTMAVARSCCYATKIYAPLTRPERSLDARAASPGGTLYAATPQPPTCRCRRHAAYHGLRLTRRVRQARREWMPLAHACTSAVIAMLLSAHSPACARHTRQEKSSRAGCLSACQRRQVLPAFDRAVRRACRKQRERASALFCAALLFSLVNIAAFSSTAHGMHHLIPPLILPAVPTRAAY